MVPPCSSRITRVPLYSSLVIDFAFRVRGYHPLWPDFPDCSTTLDRLTPTGLFRVRSPLLAESRLISVPPGTEMFQFPGFASHTYGFSVRYGRSRGFPHSEIHGSKLVRSSPWLIAAYHVLHRLCAPRHSPDALKSLDCSHHQGPSEDGLDAEQLV